MWPIGCRGEHKEAVQTDWSGLLHWSGQWLHIKQQSELGLGGTQLAEDGWLNLNLGPGGLKTQGHTRTCARREGCHNPNCLNKLDPCSIVYTNQGRWPERKWQAMVLKIFSSGGNRRGRRLLVSSLKVQTHQNLTLTKGTWSSSSETVSGLQI